MAGMRRTVMAAGALLLWSAKLLAQEAPATGPETEKRFPKLVVPDGFRATLFACDPLVEYPSVIALGPEPQTLFVAHDYVTGLGVEIVRRDEIRLLRDVDRDGYADESKVYAKEFNSIQGLAFSAGVVYVMHAPLLTSLKDTNGDGVADDRRDLIDGLGLPPEKNDNRLHCANGVAVGHDGWLYLALGDRGCDVMRPEGDRLLFQEGGILRCRPDGRDLHVLSRGLRNIYDVALDDELNVFIRDNENDGGDYMIRVAHCFHGSDHGYPYLYRERPDEALAPLADLGRGSSAGGTAYLEIAFPQEYRDSLFFCEWGRAVVRYRKERAGGSFTKMQEVDFAAGAPDDPYGLKPTDLVVDRDGSVLFSDWGDGQRPKRGRGRIYRIEFTGVRIENLREDTGPIDHDSSTDALIKGLDSPSHHIRVTAQEILERRGAAVLEPLRTAMRANQIGPAGRMHGIWILAHLAGEASIDELFNLAANDSIATVRAQAIRAIADLSDPVLASHRLDAGRADEELCRRVAELWSDSDARVKLEVLIALGRMRWAKAPAWLRAHGSLTEPAMIHAAMQLLRRADNWPALLELLDVRDENSKLRPIALRALADQAQEAVVDGLIARLQQEPDPERRSEYFALLARIHQKPAEWTYWGFRPAPRPANSQAWERTPVIADTLDAALADGDMTVRAAVVRRMLRENVPIRLERLATWLGEDASADGVAAILAALEPRPRDESVAPLEQIIASAAHADLNRLKALTLLLRESDAEVVSRLRKTADALDESPVLAAIIGRLAERNIDDLAPLLLARLDARHDDVRAAAASAFSARPIPELAGLVTTLLADHDLRVRRAAAVLAGKLEVREAAGQLLAAVNDGDPSLRAAGLDSLRQLADGRAVAAAAAALESPDSQAAGISYLGRFGSIEHLPAVLKTVDQNRSRDVQLASAHALLAWRDADRDAVDSAFGRIHGLTGQPLAWRIRGPLSAPESAAAMEAAKKVDTGQPFAEWRFLTIGSADELVHFDADADSDRIHWLAVADFTLAQPATIELIAGANAPFVVALDGRHVMEISERSTKEERRDAEAAAGLHQLIVDLAAGGKPEFRLRFRIKSTKAVHERLTKLVLETTGNAERGRELFLNAEKSQCVRCHRLGEEGGRIGPDLAGIGGRFSRIHLVESVLEPSRTIAPSYDTLAIALVSGQVTTGVKSSETESLLMLGDTQGKLHEILKADIDEISPQSKSTMPDGLEQRLTEQEFLDVIEFLSSLKKPIPK